jgi:hypothetical protein
MSETPTRDEEMFARLAERDLAAVERVHDKLMAAEATSDIAELGRTYQRMARSLRQTLALMAMLRQGQADEAARARILARRDAFDREMRTEERTLELQGALGRVAQAAMPEREEREAVLDRFDVELDDWIEADDFIEVDLDVLVLRACRRLDLPEDLGRRWRELPPEAVASDDAASHGPTGANIPADASGRAAPPGIKSG